MRTTPVFIALLVGLAGLTAGTAVASVGQSSQDQDPATPSSASVDSFVLENVSGTFTIDELTVERAEASPGTAENVTLEDATVTVENATVEVTEASSEEGNVSNVSASIEEGTVTVENATATVDGEERQLEDETLTVEDGEVTSGELSGADLPEMPLDADEFRQLAEGATIQELSIDAATGVVIDEVSIHGAEVDDRMGGAILGGVELEEVESATVTAGNVSVEDGTLVINDATVTLENAEVSVDLGIVTIDDETEVLQNDVISLDGPVTITKAELRVPLS